MKIYIPLFVFLASVSFANLVNASVLYSQSISLSPGWNIVSTPKVLDSHSFSLPETSDNFDIYVLNASSTTGWSTLADLGQTEFAPLYGYFIKNKSASVQTLTFNHKNVTSPQERLFERSFSKAGWYSIGVANATYAKKITDNVSDTNNPSKILNSTTGGYDSVVDLTDDGFAQNPNSVFVGSAWKQAVSSDIDSLNDLREAKGYLIYITQPNVLYSGFQNTSLYEAGVLKIIVDQNSNLDRSIVADRDDTEGVIAYTANINSEVSNNLLKKVTVNLESSEPLLNVVDEVHLFINDYEVGRESASTTVIFNDLWYSINENEAVSMVVKLDIKNNPGGTNFPYGTNVSIGTTSLSYIDQSNVEIESGVSVGGGTITLSEAEAEVVVDYFSWTVDTTGSFIDFMFTVEANYRSFDFLTSSIASSTAGTATASAGVLSKISGDTPTTIPGGFRVNDGDTTRFRIRYSITGANGTFAEVTITEVAGQEIPDDEGKSPTAVKSVNF